MKSLLEKEEFTFDDIQELINNEVEESVYLDYKQSESLGKTDAKKKDISKDVSSFANSDGGLIIYGIKEENHKAKSVSFINGNVYTKEWLEQTIQSNVQRNIPNLRIVPIRFNGEVEKTIYIVKIPESYLSPHMANDKKYYKRYNFQSVPMEEYEVRQLFNKKGLTKLEILSFCINEYNEDFLKEKGYKSFKATVLIKNTSNYIENTYKTIISFRNFSNKINLSTPRELKADFIRTEDFVKISIPNISPIFQNEVLTCGLINLGIPEYNIEELLDKIEIEIELLFSNGKDSKNYLMKEEYAA